MKLFKSMILCSVGALMTLFSGCSDWLDVNVDPENPTAGNATYDSRLAHLPGFGRIYVVWHGERIMS